MQEMLKDSRRHIGGIFASQPGSRKCWKDSRNVEKTHKDNPTASTKASPEAENVEKTQEDTLAEYTQASPKAKNVKKIHETHWWHFKELA